MARSQRSFCDKLRLPHVSMLVKYEVLKARSLPQVILVYEISYYELFPWPRPKLLVH
jgi:hypothetical protein